MHGREERKLPPAGFWHRVVEAWTSTRRSSMEGHMVVYLVAALAGFVDSLTLYWIVGAFMGGVAAVISFAIRVGLLFVLATCTQNDVWYVVQVYLPGLARAYELYMIFSSVSARPRSGGRGYFLASEVRPERARLMVRDITQEIGAGSCDGRLENHGSCSPDCQASSMRQGAPYYQHPQGLHGGTVQVLHLYPAGPGTRLDCYLMNYVAGTEPVSEHINHVCVHEWKMHLVWIHERPSPVSPGMHNALHKLRRATDIRYLKIDCSCFFQTSLDAAEIPLLNKWDVLSAEPSARSMRDVNFPELSNNPVAESQLYEYRPLMKREIRLLKVSREQGSSRMSYKIVHASLDSVPDYVAISYCWGDNTMRHCIECENGKVLKITASLAVLLKAIMPVEQTPYVWIDALCIDQRNNEEKSHQIPLMLEIYGSAIEVIAWLGESSGDSHLVFPFVGMLHTAIWTYRNQNLQMSMDILRQLPGCRGENSDGWTAFRNFLQRDWFQRIWILQEVVAAKKVRLRWGQDEMKWECLEEVIAFLAAWGLSRMLEIREENVAELGFLPHGYRITLTQSQLREDKKSIYRTIESLLVSGRAFAAKDERDKVYALLGLAFDATEEAFKPNYDDSVEDIYTRVATCILERQKSLDILHGAGIGNRAFPPRLDLPTWVTDWNFAAESSVLCEVPTLGFQAGGLSDIRVRIDSASGVLTIRGVILDTVHICCSERPRPPVMKSREDLRRQARLMLSWLGEREALADSLHPYPTGEACRDVLWRTFLANNGRYSQPAGPEYGESYAIYKAAFRSILEIASPAEWELLINGGSKMELFMSNWAVMCGGRGLFLTRKGYLGHGSVAMTKGDVAAVFLGGKTPFILRENAPVEDGKCDYTLVGESYIHGLMGGEGLGMGEPQDIAIK